MRALRLSLFSTNTDHQTTIKKIITPQTNTELSIYDDEAKVIESISAKAFDAILIDDALDELVKNRILKMTQLLYEEAVYTTISFEYDSFVIMKINHLLQDWQAAQSETGGFNFIDNPL